MTPSIAWSDLSIAVTKPSAKVFLLRRFQLLAADLGDKLYEGAIGLELSKLYTYNQYQRMALDRVLQYADKKDATVIISSDEDLEELGPYLQDVVKMFAEKLQGE